MSLRLDALPPEILFNILSFAEPTCDPKLVSSPLCTMAATNWHLNAIVEDYCRSLLVQHTDSKGRKAMKNTWRRKWLAQTCQYCKKKTARKATLYRALTCCQSCDWKEFPKKTMTEAITTYNISKLDLFTPNKLHPDLPRITVGATISGGSDAVMLLSSDVRERRRHIYELLGDKAQDTDYMRKRVRIHERLAMHLGIRFDIHSCEWVTVQSPADHFRGPKTLNTKESRRAYVRKVILSEWAAMGWSGEDENEDEEKAGV